MGTPQTWIIVLLVGTSALCLGWLLLLGTGRGGIQAVLTTAALPAAMLYIRLANDVNIESRIGFVGAGLALLGGGLVIARGVGTGARVLGALSSASLAFASAAEALYWHVPALGRLLPSIGLGCLVAALLLVAIKLFIDKGRADS
jgi:hypothetical protein